MAVEEGDKFKFPDESGAAAGRVQEEQQLEVSVEGDAVEIIDDTPPEDRGRKPLAEFVEPTDDEVAAYSKEVQARIKNIDHARHDERRAKEAAQREREEAARFAQQVLEENKRLKQYVETGTKAFAETSKSAAQAEMAVAEAEYRAAHEAYDTDALLAAQKKLNAAQMKLNAAENFRAPPLQEENSRVERPVTLQAPPQPDEKTVRWQAKNQWFGVDDEMTALALAVHKKLVAANVDPTSDEYFERIDARVREKFPEVFGEAQGTRPSPAKKPANVVAPTSRSSGAKKITLTQSQAALAKRMGLTLEQYAQSAAQLEQQNGR